MSHYLVTGGAGFIGSHVVERLTARGDVVRVVDDLSTGRRDNIERCAGVELVEADLTGDDVAARAVAGIDYVVQDYELGVITGAKAMAMTVIDLLSDGARQANRIKAEYNAPLTKDSYLSLMRGMLKEGTYTK